MSLGQIEGIGPKAARAIAAKHSTVRSLLDAYRRCKSMKERKEMLASIKPGSKRIGVKASESVWRSVMGSGDDRRPYQAAVTTSSWKTKSKNNKPRSTYVPPPEPTECLFFDDSE